MSENQINNESLLERQSINKGDIIGETIDKGNFWRDNQSTRETLLDRRLTRGHFKETINRQGGILGETQQDR